MNKRKFLATAALPVCLGLVFSSMAGATTLPLSSSLSETGAFVESWSGSYNLGTGLANGVLNESVYCNGTFSGGKCSGGLDFLYQMQNLSPSPNGDPIETLSLSGFGGSTVVSSTYYTASASNVTNNVGTPAFVNASGSGGVPTGAAISGVGTINFTGMALLGGYGDILEVSTNATTLTTGIAAVIDTGSQDFYNALVPAPEPLWSGLFLTAILGAGLFATRRRRNA